MDEHLLTQQQMEAIQKNGFKTEMFGFHRAQVLSYLESLSQQYVQQEAELRVHAEELQAQLMSVQNMLRESAARENALTVSRDEQARRVHMAQAETQAFRAELISTREEINSLHAKLEEAEKKSWPKKLMRRHRKHWKKQRQMPNSFCRMQGQRHLCVWSRPTSRQS